MLILQCSYNILVKSFSGAVIDKCQKYQGILQQALRNHPAVIWMDSSIRVNKTDMGFLATAIQHHDFLHFKFGVFNTVSVTHTGLYKYIPVNEAAKPTIRNRRAGFALYFRTRELYTSVMQWMVLCALDVQCIEPSHPKRLLHCLLEETTARIKRWQNCHRYDHSLLSLLVNNVLAYDDPTPIRSLSPGLTYRM